MRKITIYRRKTVIACISKMQVYIEDNIFGDTVISGVKCRRLGELKNGESKTFSIDEGKKRVFALADNMSRDVWNESITIPSGGDDVYLSGKNHYDPLNGNPFRFDDNDDEEVIRNRKKESLAWWVTCGVTACVGIIIALVIVLLIT